MSKPTLEQLKYYLDAGLMMKHRSPSSSLPYRELDISDFSHLIINYIPLFRPMSDLCKPITIDGKEKIPLVEMFETALTHVYKYVPEYKLIFAQSVDGTHGIKAKDEGWEYGFTFDYSPSTDWIDFMLTVNGDEMRINKMALFQKLFEWKFDVFNGIGTWAIDVNTLNEKI